MSEHRQAAGDPYRLQRFVDAQEAVHDTALGELRAGEKRTHWMWFVFPQLAGLGSSVMAERYAIGSLAEAAAYLDHPVLGPRLRECVATVTDARGRSANDILGEVDAMKLRSCVTLFALAAPDEPVFAACLAKHFGGAPDPETLRLLGGVRPRTVR